jgi:DNA-binding HxlR family transcriptional regulator
MKVLRQRLVELETDGLVDREKFDTRQPKVVYTLTDRGRELAAVLGQLKYLADDWYGAQCKCILKYSDGDVSETDCPERRVRVRNV